jgi:hypothetical protein
VEAGATEWAVTGGVARLAGGDAVQAFERIGIFANQEDQGGGPRIGLGTSLFPFFECPFVDVQLAIKSKNGARATKSLVT